MKLSYCLPALLSLSTATAARDRALHENATDLSNGAVLGLDISFPGFKSTVYLGDNETTANVNVKGEAHVGKGAPDVAYIYIIDSSGSTDEYDGDCGSTLQCVQAFFEELHNETRTNGSAELVAVVDFDDEARVVADFQDPSSPQILDSIHYTYSGGGTACSHALEAATLLVHKQKQAGTTVVIFAGDGQCNGGDEGGVTLVSEEVTEAADLLGDSGAIVHSIAVGDNIDCDVGNDLVSIPRNGGHCFSIPEPKALPGIIDDLIGTELTNLEVSVDGGSYRGLGISETGGTVLPQEGAVSVNFETAVRGLAEDSHEICIRATGQDSIGGVSQAEDCHTVAIKPVPTAAPAPMEAPESKFNSDSFKTDSDWSPGKVIFVVAICILVLLLF